MARDYKPTTRKQKAAGKGSVFFTGFLLGLVIGVGASAAVVMFVKGGESPFMSPEPASRPPAVAEPKPEAPPADPNSRFDFYNILPDNQSAATEQEIQNNLEEQQKAAASQVQESYYLQVGAFQTEQEADNIKASLALMGLEAVVQTVNVPDKGVLHRVRVGPYASAAQMEEARAQLKLNGFSADTIKVSNNNPD